MPVFKSSSRKYYVVDWARGTKVSVLGSTREKGFNYNIRHFIMEVGGEIPIHIHTNIYHLQYMLRGRIKLLIGDDIHVVEAGDVMYLPSRVRHGYLNIGGEHAEFLCITPLIPDQMRILGWISKEFG